MLFNPLYNASCEEIRKYISVDKNFSIDKVQPYVTSAESDYLVPLIGSDLYDELTAYYEAQDFEETSLYYQLLQYCEKAVINIAFYTGFHTLNTQFTGQGTFKFKSDKTQGLYKYQEDAMINSFKNNGFNELDRILIFLERNKDEFLSWTNSDKYTIFRELFVETADQFNKVYPIKSSRLVFLKIKPFMQIVEDFEITPVLGVGTVEMLRTAKAGTATAKQSTALTKLRSAIVFLSIAAAIDELAVDVTEKGLYFEETESSAANDVKLTALQGAKLDRIASKAKINGHKYLRTLQDFMELYPDDFEDYKTFIEAQEDYELDNDKIVFLGNF